MITMSSLLECCSFVVFSNEAVEECTALEFAIDEVMEEFEVTNNKIMI